MNSLTDNNSAFERPRLGRSRGGFTLVEVMISLALVLLLMYGVSQVFKMSSDAVGANQAVSTMVRAQRSAQSVLAEDWRSCATDSPLFLISSAIGYAGPANSQSWVTGFRNVQEQRNNGNDDPTFFDDSTHKFLALGSSDRVPRLDRLGFFARGSYRRQSTPDDPTKPLATSGEAYIWLGHLAVDNGTKRTDPENQFAADRILGRMAVLMRDGSTAGSNVFPPVVGQGGNSNAYLWPFAYDTGSQSVYSDLASLSMDQFRLRANAAFDASSSKIINDWYAPMEIGGGKALRYWCNPTVTHPVTAEVLSSKVPIFVPNCTQFIVEYAGDYLNQDPQTGLPKHGMGQNLQTNGGQFDATTFDVADAVNEQPKDVNDPLIVHGTTDGQIDYVLDKSLDQSSGKNDSSKWVRRIRWYGLPRDIDGDGLIGRDDVVPLAEVLRSFQIQVNGARTQASWEKILPPDPPAKGYQDLDSNLATKFLYTCAWHNSAPPMIRILIKIGDPTGKLQDGQWYEYVLSR
jgi:prepilin-type N-terminal cleavage/methylation domain-containing protein